MSKRKSYEERLCALNARAKDEIRELLTRHGITRLDIPEGDVNVTSQDSGGAFGIFPVKKVELVRQNKPHSGEVLTFDYRGGIAWYENPAVWCQIADAIRKILKEN